MILATNSSEKSRNFWRRPFFLFWSSPSIRPNKGLSFWRRPFFGLRHHLNFWIKPFSCGPLEWWSPQEPCSTKCGSLVQTVIDPQPSNTFSRAMPQLSVSQYAYSHCTRVLNWQSVINCKLNICQFSLKQLISKCFIEFERFCCKIIMKLCRNKITVNLKSKEFDFSTML